MPTSTSAGYSGTPLARKLGIVADARVAIRNAPAAYERLVAPLPSGVVIGTRVTKTTDVVHVFVVEKSALKKELSSLRKAIKPEAIVWVSWPKKAAKVATDVTEETIREICLPLGFVDVKVCAVDATWSGLKLVIRRELR